MHKDKQCDLLLFCIGVKLQRKGFSERLGYQLELVLCLSDIDILNPDFSVGGFRGYEVCKVM